MRKNIFIFVLIFILIIPTSASAEIFIAMESTEGIVPSTAIASIADLEAAMESGGKYYLTADIVFSSKLDEITTNLEIDLRGFSITRSSGGTIFKNSGTLAITDSSVAKTGYVGFTTATKSTTISYGVLYNTSVGTCIISDCILKDMNCSGSAPIYNSGVLTLNNVHITNVNNTHAEDTNYYQGAIFNKGTLNINGGLMEKCSAAVGCAIYNVANLVIDKGFEIKDCTSSGTTNGQIIYNGTASSMNIKNAIITSGDSDETKDIHYGGTKNSAIIEGGIIKATIHSCVTTKGGKYINQPSNIPTGYGFSSLTDDPDGCNYMVDASALAVDSVELQGTISDTLGLTVIAGIKIPSTSSVPKVKCTNNSSGEIKYLDGVKRADGKYEYSLNDIYMTCIDDTFSFEFVDGKDTSKSVYTVSDTYSVLGYYQELYGNYGSNTKLVSLLANTINYAECLKEYSGESLEDDSYQWVANAINENNYSKTLTQLRSYPDSSKKDNKVTGVSLTISDQIAFRFYVTTTDDAILKLYDYYENEIGSRTISGAQTDYMVKFGECKIGPDEYDEVYKARLFDSSGKTVLCEVKYSVGTYCNNMKDTTDVSSLVSAIYNFGVAFNEYKYSQAGN